jgi:DNA-binding transcriptional LysR family regulator
MNTIKIAPLLLIFVEVAKLGSFTQAAKNLNLSKSAVSQQIKRLEEELKTQLISRNTRGLTLTLAGEMLLNSSALLADHLSNTIQDLNTHKAQPSGVFRISIPPFFERNILVPALRQLRLEYPLIQPEVLVEGRWKDLIDNNLDAAIFGGTLKDSEYKAQSIGKVRDVFCCTPNYLKQAGEFHQLEDIKQRSFIATPWQKGCIKLYKVSNTSEIKITIEHQCFTNSLNTLIDMVLADIGIALIPEFIAHKELRQGHLIRILPEYHGQDWHFYYLHRYKISKPSHVERFYSLIKHFFHMTNENL